MSLLTCKLVCCLFLTLLCNAFRIGAEKGVLNVHRRGTVMILALALLMSGVSVHFCACARGGSTCATQIAEHPMAADACCGEADRPGSEPSTHHAPSSDNSERFNRQCGCENCVFATAPAVVRPSDLNLLQIPTLCVVFDSDLAACAPHVVSSPFATSPRAMGRPICLALCTLRC